MDKSKRNRISFFFWIAVSVVICIVIFFFSAQNGDSSGNVSRGVTRKLFPAILSDEVIYSIEKIIRKLAHYGIYFALGISVYFSYNGYVRGYKLNEPSLSKKICIPALVCFVYSLTDEFHQYFVPDRNGTFVDCLLDTFGALSGVLCVIFSTALLRKIAKK